MQKAKDTFLYRILLFLLPLCLLSCSKDENEVTTEMYENLQAGDYSGVENRHAYVDLGLSVKWAACNIGAQQKWGWGSTFEWGFTTPQANVKTGPLPNGIEPYPNQMDGEYDAGYDCRLQEWYEIFIAKITKESPCRSRGSYAPEARSRFLRLGSLRTCLFVKSVHKMLPGAKLQHFIQNAK